MGLPAMLMLYCGLRRGEIIALTWGDINIKERQIFVSKSATFNKNASSLKEPKSKAGKRIVPIPDIVLPCLQENAKRPLLVCPSQSGMLMTHAAFKRAWESYLHFLNIKAGGRDASRSHPKVQFIANITPHMLRHTYATMLYDAGVDVKSAQKFLGHAEVTTTLQIYTHLSEEKEQTAIDALNNHLNDEKRAVIKKSWGKNGVNSPQRPPNCI
jgi:integrase